MKIVVAMVTGRELMCCHLLFSPPTGVHTGGTIGLLSIHSSVLKSGSRDNSKTIQVSLMKLGMSTVGNVLIMHIIFFGVALKLWLHRKGTYDCAVGNTCACL